MVSKDAVLTMIREKRIDECRRPAVLRALTKLYDSVKDLPDENPAAVHAHWEIDEYKYLTCSNCGKMYYTGCLSTDEAGKMLKDKDEQIYKYCPYCGAVMDE